METVMDDAELLRSYAERRDQRAFAEFVRRHLDFVYGVALRRVGGDRQMAEDVSQDVFSSLAKKASTLCRRPIVTGWLHTAARYSAASRVRTERRRREREEAAHSMAEINYGSPVSADWEGLRPAIDEAIGQLNERDRMAILL